MPNATKSGRNLTDLYRPVKRRRLQREIDTILSESDGTIEDHQLCDHLIDTTTDSNKRLRSELADTRAKLAKVQRDYDELESDHTQCPYWIQRNESLATTLDDRCEKLEKENEKLQNICDELTSEIRRLRTQNCDELDNTDREEQDDIQ
ncbi:hypothetical protein N7499_003351 [Penicillium canescens]|uniref:Uncharacterized protein n=1 Tax=Penicillium canescens TaxID=5083 RepID=A0AAD6I8X0_PENCN|nr:uncharacterized protein N7446_012263 [Penicillium canescens]KAJ6020055.1 hypothetical protein N7522_000130 [Penicillium canescens]KAJ6037988.1 hypothetical protein N7460_007759 [Penicillium canescens]KAJ6045399.1 hypothetical protein N7446_012263 [Penicillium canescens]KAJ6090637.1 hypothetical protein N7499_003351 [Penicillium canescens]